MVTSELDRLKQRYRPPCAAEAAPIALPRPANRNGARRRRQGQPPAGRRSVRSAALRRSSRTRLAMPRTSTSTARGCHHHRQLRRQAAEFSRRLDRRTGRQRNRERSGGLGREGRSSGRHLCSRSRAAHAGSRSRSSRHGERRAQKRVLRIAGGDTKVVEHGKADQHVHHDHRYRPPASRSRRSTLARCAPATRFCSPDRSAITASPFCWRAANWISKPIFVPTRAPCFRWSKRSLQRRWARHSLDARSDARRRGHVAQRTGARLRSGHRAFRRSDSGARYRARRLRTAGSRSAAHRERRPVPRGRRTGVRRRRDQRA